MGVLVKERERRMDEGNAMMQAVWNNDPVSFELPRPVVPFPVWIGGIAERQIARAAKLHGRHGSRQSPEFAMSMRIRWDGVDAAELRSRLKACEAMDVGHMLVEPNERDRLLEGIDQIAGG